MWVSHLHDAEFPKELNKACLWKNKEGKNIKSVWKEGMENISRRMVRKTEKKSDPSIKHLQDYQTPHLLNMEKNTKTAPFAVD